MLDKEILFCGDTYFKNKVTLPNYDSNLILNLEAPITNSNKPVKNKVNLKFSYQSFIDTFLKQRIHAVNLSNNHIFDFGIDGFNDTIKVLNELNIKYFGVTKTKNNIPLIIEKNIAVLSYCCKSTHPTFNLGEYFIHDINLTNIKTDIAKYKNKYKYLILQFHWGDEEIFFPKPDDVKIARKCVEFGADLIIGHHAHVIQSCETYRNKKIFYGIGNFVFSNLNEPSYFDGNNYKSKYIKKQFSSNKKSMCIRLKQDLRVEVNHFNFNSKLNEVKKVKYRINFTNFVTINNFYYNFLKILSLRVKMIKIFCSSPKIISFKKIKIFLGF